MKWTDVETRLLPNDLYVMVAVCDGINGVEIFSVPIPDDADRANLVKEKVEEINE